MNGTFGLNQYPFAFMSQFFNTEKILVVDHITLHQIAQKIDRLEGNCVLINNTGRCGSTLICQVGFVQMCSVRTALLPVREANKQFSIRPGRH